MNIKPILDAYEQESAFYFSGFITRAFSLTLIKDEGKTHKECLQILCRIGVDMGQ